MRPSSWAKKKKKQQKNKNNETNYIEDPIQLIWVLLYIVFAIVFCKRENISGVEMKLDDKIKDKDPWQPFLVHRASNWHFSFWNIHSRRTWNWQQNKFLLRIKKRLFMFVCHQTTNILLFIVDRKDLIL